MNPLIIDTGSGTCRAGFANESSPRTFVQSITAHPSMNLVTNFQGKNQCFVGKEAWSKRGVFKLRHPVESGIVVNWGSAEVLWHHIYDHELRCKPEDHAVVHTVSPANPISNQNSMLETLFERFNTPALYLESTAVLALFASGRITGVVLDSGQDSTSCVAISEGKILSETLEQTDLAGKGLTEYLRMKMMERGIPWTTSAEIAHVGEIKEKFCYVPPGLGSEVERFSREGNALRKPCGEFEDTQIFIEEEQFLVGEALFAPSMMGSTASGLDRMVFDAISKAPEAIQSTLYQNIVLAGGTTLMPGFAARLKHDLELFSPNGTQINIIAPTNRQSSAWVGGSKLVSLPMFKESWVTKEQYEEQGSNVAFNFNYIS